MDQLRFVAALFVVLTHTVNEPPVFKWIGLDDSHGILNLIRGVYWKFFFVGAPGVIIFFVISGFCIHYPFSRSLHIDSLPAYFTRRYLRIGLPVLPILLYWHFFGGLSIIGVFSKTVLWSIVCEVIYYTIYPLLLIGRRFFDSWWPLVVASYAASIAAAMLHPYDKSMWFNFGLGLTWILGLPCWLLGVALVDKIHKSEVQQIGAKSICAWRLGIWVLAAITIAMTFRGPFGDPWTLNLFAVAVFFWLAKEIDYARTHPPIRWIESFGLWSYSLYLIHPIIWLWWRRYLACEHPFGPIYYAISLFVVLSLAYLYYLIIERPSHLFSGAAGKWVARQLL